MFLLLRAVLLVSRGSRLLLYDYLIVGSSVCYIGEVSFCSYVSSSTSGSRVHEASLETRTIEFLEASSCFTGEMLSSLDYLEPEPSSE